MIRLLDDMCSEVSFAPDAPIVNALLSDRARFLMLGAKTFHTLAEQVLDARARLPEVLAHGLDGLSPLPNRIYRYVLEFLVSQPSADALARFGPTAEMQERVDELLEKNRAETISPAESEELDEFVRIDQLITLLKARALPLVPSSG